MDILSILFIIYAKSFDFEILLGKAMDIVYPCLCKINCHLILIGKGLGYHAPIFAELECKVLTHACGPLERME